MQTSGRRAVGLVLLGVLLMQVAWIITIPPFRGIDEFDHAFRAAAVARGEWVAGDAAEDGRGRLVTVPGSLVEAAHEQCSALAYTGPDNCSPVALVDDDNVLVASAAASYHPAYYWLIGTAARPFDGAGALYAMRVAAAGLCLLFVAMATWALLRLPGRWPMAALLLALPPVFVYSTTMPAPNGPEMCAGLALWSALLALIHGQSHSRESRLLWAAIASAVFLATLRVLGPVLLVLIVASIAAFAPRQLWGVIRRHPWTVTAGALLTAASAIGQVIWMYQAVEDAVTSEESDGPRSFEGTSVILWPIQSIAVFPLRGDAAPMVVYPIALALVIIMVAVAVRRTSHRLRWAIIGTLVVSQLIPLAFTLATVGTIGAIWQGRYGLPYSVGFLLLAGYALGIRRPGPLPARLTVPAVIAYGAAVVACLVKIRDDERLSRPASFNDPAWNVPPVVVLVGLVAVSAVAFFLLLSSGRSEGHLAGPSRASEPAKPRPAGADR